VVECLFDQIVSSVPVASQDVVALDVESVVVDTGRSIDRRIAFVWVRDLGNAQGLGRYLAALEQCLAPYLVTYRCVSRWLSLRSCSQ